MGASRCHYDSGRPNSKPQSSLWIIQIRLPHRPFPRRTRPRASPRQFQHPPPASRRLRRRRSRQKRPPLLLLPASRRRGRGARTAPQKAAEHPPSGRPAYSGCPKTERVFVSIAIRATVCCWIESSRESNRRSPGFFVERKGEDDQEKSSRRGCTRYCCTSRPCGCRQRARTRPLLANRAPASWPPTYCAFKPESRDAHATRVGACGPTPRAGCPCHSEHRAANGVGHRYVAQPAERKRKECTENPRQAGPARASGSGKRGNRP